MLGFAVAALAGCANAPVERKLTVGGTLKLPGDTARVTIAVSRGPGEFELNTPASGVEAVGHTLGEFSNVPRDPRLLASTPVVAAMTGAVAAVFGLSPGTVESASGAIAKATMGDQMSDRIAQTLHARLSGIFPGKVERVPDVPMPPVPEKRARREVSGQVAAAPTEFLVHVRLMFAGLQVRPTARNDDLIKMAEAANPPLVLVVALQALAVAVTGGDFSGGVSVVYESVPRRLERWAGDEARLLREELAAAEKEISAEMLARTAGP